MYRERAIAVKERRTNSQACWLEGMWAGGWLVGLMGFGVLNGSRQPLEYSSLLIGSEGDARRGNGSNQQCG